MLLLKHLSPHPQHTLHHSVFPLPFWFCEQMVQWTCAMCCLAAHCTLCKKYSTKVWLVTEVDLSEDEPGPAAVEVAAVEVAADACVRTRTQRRREQRRKRKPDAAQIIAAAPWKKQRTR